MKTKLDFIILCMFFSLWLLDILQTLGHPLGHAITTLIRLVIHVAWRKQ